MQFISVSINNQLVELGSPLPDSIYEFSVLLFMNVALNAAINNKNSVALFSLEMGADEIAKRMFGCKFQLQMSESHQQPP